MVYTKILHCLFTRFFVVGMFTRSHCCFMRRQYFLQNSSFDTGYLTRGNLNSLIFNYYVPTNIPGILCLYWPMVKPTCFTRLLREQVQGCWGLGLGGLVVAMGWEKENSKKCYWVTSFAPLLHPYREGRLKKGRVGPPSPGHSASRVTEIVWILVRYASGMVRPIGDITAMCQEECWHVPFRKGGEIVSSSREHRSYAYCRYCVNGSWMWKWSV